MSFLQLQSQPTSSFVISGLKIEKTGPETAKISPKMAKKNDFRPFLGQIWVFSAKKWAKRTAAVSVLQLQGQTTICLVRFGLKIEKNRSRTAKISPKTAKIAQKCTFLGQIWVSEAENGVRRTAPVSFLHLQGQTMIFASYPG